MKWEGPGWLRHLGVPLAAGLAFAGQYLISLRAGSIALSTAPGLVLYAVAFALLVWSLRAGRSVPASAPGGGTADLDRHLAGRAGWILLALILGAGLWLRLYRIDVLPPGLNNDEGINAIEANEIAHGKPFATFTQRGLNRETMFHYLAALSYRNPGLGLNILRAMPAVFGLSARYIRDPLADLIVPLRLVAIVAGTLTILALYLFVKEYFGPRPALLAALFMAVSPWHLLYSRVGLRVILGAPFALLTAGLFLRALRRGTWPHHLAWGIAAGLGCWTYTSFRAVPLALVAFLAIRYVRGPHGGERGAPSPRGVDKAVLAGIGALGLLFIAIMVLSGLPSALFLFRGAYASSPPEASWGANLLHTVTMLNYYPPQYAVISTRIFISDGVSAVFGLVGLEPDTLLLAAFASLGMVYAAWRVIGRSASGEGTDEGRDALALALLCIGATWVTLGWLGPSLTRMCGNVPWFCVCAAVLATRVWDDLADWKPPLSGWAAGILMAGVGVLASLQGISNYFWLAGRSEQAMQHFGATQTIMGMFVRTLPPDQDVVILHTRREDTLHYLVGDRPHVEFLTDTSKVSLETIVGTPRTVTFVVEYARPFAEPLRTLMMRFPQGDMTQVADARVDPDRPIFYTFTLWKDAEGKIIPAPGSAAEPSFGFEAVPPAPSSGAPPPGAPPPS
jgi:hypothetical protein